MPFHVINPRTKRPPTTNQRKLLEWIIDYKKKNREMPTQAEMAARFKITVASVRDRLIYLAKKGYIELPEPAEGRVPQRSLKVLRKP